MPIRVKIRRDTAANWTSANPKLGDGEMGVERDTGFLKIGDGVTNWNGLPYVNSGGGGSVPANVLRNVTTGVVLYQEDNSLVGGAFVIPGYYRKTASGWDFPPHLQEQTFERFAITTFPYTLTTDDARNGMVFLQPAAAASVILPTGLVSSPTIANRRTYLDVIFYIDGAVPVTFSPGSGASLFVPGFTPAQASYVVNGPRRTVIVQARSTNFRFLD